MLPPIELFLCANDSLPVVLLHASAFDFQVSTLVEPARMVSNDINADALISHEDALDAPTSPKEPVAVLSTTEAVNEPRPKSPKGRHFWLVLFALLLSTFFAILEAVSHPIPHRLAISLNASSMRCRLPSQPLCLTFMRTNLYG